MQEEIKKENIENIYKYHKCICGAFLDKYAVYFLQGDVEAMCIKCNRIITARIDEKNYEENKPQR